MPNFAQHDYGTSNMMKWMLPALQAKQQAKTTWESDKQKRQQEFLGKEIEAGTMGSRGSQQAESLYGPGGAQRAQRMSAQNKAKIEVEGMNAKFVADTAGLTLVDKLMKTAQDFSNADKYPEGQGAQQADAIWGKIKTVFGKIGVGCNVSRFQDAATNKHEMEVSATGAIKKKMETLSDPKFRNAKSLGLLRVDLNNAGRTYGRDKFTGFLDTAKSWEKELSEGGAKPTGDMGQFHQMYGRKPTTPQELQTFKAGIRPEPQATVSEREILKRQKATTDLVAMAKQDPNKAYSHGYRMNTDGSLYIDPVDKAPIKLPHFTKVMGKRGGPKMAKMAGEAWDDTVEIQTLLQDPEVEKNLKWADEDGVWDRVKGTWSNRIKHWMTKKGITANSKTGEAIIRMQRLASVERLKYLGSAVTGTELESILGWMPSSGDSFSTTQGKMKVAAAEGEETFRRYLELYQDIADMSPFYKAFGIERFKGEASGIDSLKAKYKLE